MGRKYKFRFPQKGAGRGKKGVQFVNFLVGASLVLLMGVFVVAVFGGKSRPTSRTVRKAPRAWEACRKVEKKQPVREVPLPKSENIPAKEEVSKEVPSFEEVVSSEKEAVSSEKEVVSSEKEKEKEKDVSVRVLVTGYCNCGTCCSWKRSWFGFGRPVYTTGKMKGRPKQVGMTANGHRAKHGTIAADLSVFGFGTQLEVPEYGVGEVQDVGGSIRGHHIDIWFPTHEQARRWGRRYLDVRIIAKQNDDLIDKRTVKEGAHEVE